MSDQKNIPSEMIYYDETILESAINLIKYYSRYTKENFILSAQVKELERFEPEVFEAQIRSMAKVWLKKHNIK